MMDSGYYWYYTLGYNGVPIEDRDRPSICWYNADRNTIAICGCDYDMELDSKDYEIIRKITWNS